MNKRITILTFTYPQEAYIIKTKLESENINVFIKDELSVQTYNFLSNAIGGVKLQVAENEYEQALKILREYGYTKGNKESNSAFASKFNEISKKIPIINKLSYEKKLVLFLVVISILIFLIFLTISK